MTKEELLELLKRPEGGDVEFKKLRIAFPMTLTKLLVLLPIQMVAG